MKLAELQRAFQRRVLTGDTEILAELDDNSRTDKRTLMHVYEHAYGARLAEVLEGDFEKLRQALGAEGFSEMAAAYVAAAPSDNPNARYFGRKLPGFLSAAPPWKNRPWLGELARLEWAMSEVFVAEDPPRLAMEAMAALHPHDWPRLAFQIAGDVRRIDTAHGGPEAWLALNDGEDPAAAAAAAPERDQAWLVWRQNEQANFRAAEPSEAWAFDRAAIGENFAGLCEGLMDFASAEAAATLMAGYLRGWIETGLIAGYEIADA